MGPVKIKLCLPLFAVGQQIDNHLNRTFSLFQGVWHEKVAQQCKDLLPFATKGCLRPSIPDPAHMTFDEMAKALGLSDRQKLAKIVAGGHLILYHWSQVGSAAAADPCRSLVIP